MKIKLKAEALHAGFYLRYTDNTRWTHEAQAAHWNATLVS